MNLKAIIFDFDGVICESVEAKTEAFRRLFENYPEHLESILQFHIQNGGMSRYEKFKIIYRDFLKLELTEEKSKELGRKFSEYSYQPVLNSEFVKGAYEFLNKYYKELFLFVASGTPQEEMISIVQERNLTRFFRKVYGSPRGKFELIDCILKENRFTKNEVIFVGDSINDHAGALRSGIRFIGRIHPHYPNPFEGLPIEKMIRDISELDSWLENI